jgi:hypothetical protein
MVKTPAAKYRRGKARRALLVVPKAGDKQKISALLEPGLVYLPDLLEIQFLSE